MFQPLLVTEELHRAVPYGDYRHNIAPGACEPVMYRNKVTELCGG